jgi:hypothetical protein
MTEFRSFFQAGFECTSARTRNGLRLRQARATQHERYLSQDYRRLRSVGIRTVREGVSWPHADTGGALDLSPVRRIVRASAALRMQVIFDLCHFGYPDGADPFSASFAERFADYCFAIARLVAARSTSSPFFTPINEPSYFAWAGGEVGLFAPFATERGWELKVSLVRAAIAGIDAIRTACPQARFVNTDPLCWVVAPDGVGELRDAAGDFNSHQVYQAWDMLAGRLMPELGGSPRHLDMVGINYYNWNQWELGAPFSDPRNRVTRPLAEDDPRRRPAAELIGDVWRRYSAEMLISETSHPDPFRARWLRRIAAAAERLARQGVPVRGICLYPVLSMPLWQDQRRWLHMGLWDLKRRGSKLVRLPARRALQALRMARRARGPSGSAAAPAGSGGRLGADGHAPPRPAPGRSAGGPERALWW